MFPVPLLGFWTHGLFPLSYCGHADRGIQPTGEASEVTVTHPHNVLTTTSNVGQSICVLPPHPRCVAFPLNLFATIDKVEVDKWLASNPDLVAVDGSSISEYLEELSGKKTQLFPQ